MTMLECLDFVNQLHDYIERQVDRPGPWCWPTRELVNKNLNANKAAFPRDKYLVNSFGDQLRIAKRKGWAVVGGCKDHCHADHVRLTGLGQDMLALMKDQGCKTGDHVDLVELPKYRFQKKVA